MKIFAGFFIVVLTMTCSSLSLNAQDVYISVPASNIFNRTEFVTVQNVLNTRNHTNWRAGAVDPKIWAIRSEYFAHNSLSGVSLPTSVLHWRLFSMGGQLAPFQTNDTWPEFKWFNKNQQTWYQPRSSTQGYTAGNVDFTFKMPSQGFLNNAFVAGQYSLDVTHNYGRSGWFAIEFTPDNLQVVISVPAAIQWTSSVQTKFIEISSLNNYRTSGTQTVGGFGLSEVANTVGFNLMARSSSSTVQFTSSKGVTGTRSVSSISLGSTNPKLITSPLSSSWKNYSPSTNFKVEVGNRNNFDLQLSISESDFKNQFFEAGTYTFQINLDAKSPDNTVSSTQNMDVTLKVHALSEITIPSSGKQVVFNFNTAQDYMNGQTKIAPNQLKISNNETFELYVKSDAAYFTKSGIQSDVTSDILQIGVVGGSQNVALSTTSQKIITSGTPVLDKDLDINYIISPAAAQSLVAKEKSTYSINVIYSFTAL